MKYDYDICIIGAGSGGLVMAAVAANLGHKVALIEGRKMGGDCLNYGCVPSKSILAASKSAHSIKAAEKFGIDAKITNVDFSKVHKHIHDVIAKIEPNDSVERFSSFGVDVIEEFGNFVSSNVIKAGDREITAKKFVVATGSSPFIPPIDGLNDVDFLTNETIFDLTELPKHLVIVGGGPIGCEMAQAFVRLGSKVTVLQRDAGILHNDDPELVKVVANRLIKDGVEIKTECNTNKIAKDGGIIKVEIEQNGKPEILEASHLLVAAGRKANVENIGLDKANIDYSARGINVDDGLKTSNENVYAIGDCIGGYQFTHMAGYHAGVIIKRLLFGGLNSKVDYSAVPWVTYTEPELAHVGLNEDQAREKHDDITVIKVPFSESDRANAELQSEGLVKVIIDKKGFILGASIVGPHAGELIATWCFMITNKNKLKTLSSVIHAYPSYSEINKKVVSEYYKPLLYSKKTRLLSKVMFKIFG